MSSINNGVATTTNVAISSNTPVISVAGNQGGDAIGQINELMVQMGQLFGKLRDLLRQYNQVQQKNAFQMQKTSFNTRLASIKTEFSAKETQAIGQIVGGVLQTAGGGLSCFGAARTGASWGWMAGSSHISQGGNSIIEGIIGLETAPELRKAQEGQALADYQHGLADQQLKRADESLDKALKVSSDLREMLSTLTQAHERLASSVRMS